MFAIYFNLGPQVRGIHLVDGDGELEVAPADLAEAEGRLVDEDLRVAEGGVEFEHDFVD